MVVPSVGVFEVILELVVENQTLIVGWGNLRIDPEPSVLMESRPLILIGYKVRIPDICA